ncbi:MAG: cation transporter [Clostridia bacterium]|nr:cation transporter [Clostridia bacterium]MBP5780836.1 cation transporter [Clostridia bacterium]
MISETDQIALKAKKREKTIIRTSFVGIGANVFLAAFKLFVGLISASIAVMLDAVNNFTDALSSVVTIIGTKLANRRPDKKHPMGHGRAEYLSALIIAAIVLYAGITSLVESIKKIINPSAADYSVISLVIIAVAVVVKILLGLYVGKKGRDTDSDSLKASGKDALFDAILSASVLASALIFVLFHISLESYVGILISGFIIKSGIEMLIETLNKILGERADSELTTKIKSLLKTLPEVHGAYDLVIHSYGPEKLLASVHLEVPDYLTATQIDTLARRAQLLVMQETGVILTAVGIYSYNTSSGEAGVINEKIREKVLAHEWALELHGLYVDEETKSIRFDVVMSFDIPHDEGLKILYAEMNELYPEYRFFIVADVDASDVDDVSDDHVAGGEPEA